MKEIKFRAWLFDKKIMAYSDKENGLYSIDKIIFMTNTIVFSDSDPLLSRPYFVRAFSYAISDKNVKLMQYTGLKDKNGVEIYEGDIVKIGDEKCNFNGVISFENSGWHISTHLDPFTLYGVTSYLIVVGNKYENPELLSKIENEK